MQSIKNKFINTLTMTVSATILIALPFQAQAFDTLVGDTVDGTFNIGGGPTNFFDMGLGTAPVSAVIVDPGVEFSSSGLGIGVTTNFFSSTGQFLTLDFTNPFPFSVNLLDLDFLFENIEWQIGSGVIDSVDLLAGATPSSIGWSNNGMFVNTLSIGYDDPLVIGAFGTTSSVFQINAILLPEPSTYLLMGSMIGLALFTARARQKKARAPTK